MSKKLLSLVVALAMVCSVFALSAFAVGGYGFESEEDVAAGTYQQTWALDEAVDNGDGTYSVNVRLTANYSVGPIEFTLVKTVSAGSLTLTNAVAGAAIPANWYASVSFNAEKDKVMITPYPVDEGAAGTDLTEGGVVAVLTYTASSDVVATLAVNVDDAYTQSNPAGTLIAARMSDENVVTGTAICGQVVNATNTINIGAASTPPTLVAIDGTLGVVDTSRTMMDEWDNDGDGDYQEVDGYLFGFDPDANSSLEELFAVEGDGTMSIVATDAGSEAATGTLVQVLDSGNNVVATYVNIVFGDVNGDGAADTTDASYVELHDAWMLEPNGRLWSYQEVAGDVNVDGSCDTTDASYVELHDAWILDPLGRIDVAGNIAALGF